MIGLKSYHLEDDSATLARTKEEEGESDPALMHDPELRGDEVGILILEPLSNQSAAERSNPAQEKHTLSRVAPIVLEATTSAWSLLRHPFAGLIIGVICFQSLPIDSVKKGCCILF